MSELQGSIFFPFSLLDLISGDMSNDTDPTHHPSLGQFKLVVPLSRNEVQQYLHLAVLERPFSWSMWKNLQVCSVQFQYFESSISMPQIYC